ncbi:OLC1v1020963C1 [Oldenlandia corymbosa var. corymbosa]|uniref:OLC1v1020963C1 n=1 Tax=Oldenlandia corymbosa var. corymbosa TaxID=529605 RepID=A0AAV1BUL6_OLDCO|nr:OLC1v1020963C1 [Oldenlandia corymbosa var. corymbosa]
MVECKQIVDPKLASYGVEDPIYAVTQLAQTTMRSELGKITFDKTFEERDTLNEKIVIAINEAAKDWGLQCLRYEIKDISPPHGVRVVMEMQAEAERRKRAQILEAEGERQSTILTSEAAKLDQVNRAEGEAEAIRVKSEATAKGITMISHALRENGGLEAASLRVAEQYVNAFSKIAQESTTMLLPSNASDAASMVSQSLALYKKVILDQQHSGHDVLVEDLKSAGTSSAESSSTNKTDERSDGEEAAVKLPKLRK